MSAQKKTIFPQRKTTDAQRKTTDEASVLRSAPRIAQQLLLSLILFTGGCRPASPVPVKPAESAPAVSFVTSPGFAALEYQYQNGATGQNAIVESLGGGVGLFDFDLDGWLDLCCPAGGQIEAGRIGGRPTRLARQIGPDQFVSVEREAGLDAVRQLTHGCSIADYNHDGFPDALITGYGALTLWQNMGDGTFLDVTDAAGLHDKKWSTSAAWGDINGDGVLDLYVAHYVNWSFENHPACPGPSGAPDVCPPRRFEGVDDVLYLSDGSGVFTDESVSAGLVPGGKGLGVVLADFDHDGDLDIYVANDTTPNFFYRNLGGGHLHEEGLSAGVALDDMANANGSMGITLISNDCPGDPDIWVTNYEDELFGLYHNQKDGTFAYNSRKAGLNRLGQLFVGFGCVSGDFDHDGDEDVAVSNGHVVYHPLNAPVKQQPLLMINNGHEQFTRAIASKGTYFEGKYVGRGVAVGDLNRDGRLDLVFVPSDAPTCVTYNVAVGQTASTLLKPSESVLTNSLRVRLIGIQSPRDGLGAQATLTTSLRKEGRQLFGGGSYLSTSDLRFHWGLEVNEQVQKLAIDWPSGAKSMLNDFELKRISHAIGELIVREPEMNR